VEIARADDKSEVTAAYRAVNLLVLSGDVERELIVNGGNVRNERTTYVFGLHAKSWQPFSPKWCQKALHLYNLRKLILFYYIGRFWQSAVRVVSFSLLCCGYFV